MTSWEQPPLTGLDGSTAVDTRALIRRYRAEGYGFAAVASLLNADEVPTPSGRGRWWAATVRQYLEPEAHAARVAERRRRGRAG